MKFLVSIFFLFHITGLLSQPQMAQDSKISYELKEERVTIDINNDELNLTHSVKERKRFNEEVSRSYSSDRVYNNYFTKVTNLKATIDHLNKKGKYKTFTIDDIPEKSDFSGSTFYDDNSYFEVEYPNVMPGSISELVYDVEINDPHFLKRFYFSEFYPVSRAFYSITADPGVELGWKLYGEQKDLVNFTQREENGTQVYEWSLVNATPIIFEEDDPGYLHKSTHLVVYIKKYEGKTQTFNVLNDVNDLFDWYQTFIARIKGSDTDNLAELTKSVVGDASTNLEKAKRIFYWVQDNIRYIAFEDGWRGFVPFPAAEICEKRYGDCKDMSHLLYEMLSIAGIQAEHSWVGTRSLPYSYNETPCPSVDNHLILSVTIDNKIYLLDATNANTPFGVPTSFILSKETLFKSKSGGYTLYTVPEYTAAFCPISQEIELSINGNDVAGNARKTVETFEYSNFHNRYGSANIEKEQFLKEYLQLGQNNFELLESEVTNIDPRIKTAIDFKFNIPNYVTSFGDLYFINLNLTRPFAEKMIQKERKYDLEIDYKKEWNSSVVFNLPADRTVSELPEVVDYSCEFGSCKANYKIVANQVIYTRNISINTLAVPKSSFVAWNTFIKELIALYNTTIELKKA